MSQKFKRSSESPVQLEERLIVKSIRAYFKERDTLGEGTFKKYEEDAMKEAGTE